MKPLFSALRFLTLLPIPDSWCGDEDDFNQSPNWYPLVGLLIGLVLMVCDQIFCWLLPLPVASVLLLVAMIAVSGALHLDGLADSADAFFSSRGREQMLEIMKDSRSGPMGVTAIVLLLLLKLMLLISLPPAWRWQVVILTPLAGRSSLTFVSSWLAYARATGTGAFTSKESTRGRMLIAVAVTLVATLMLLGGVAGLGTFILIALGVTLLGRYSQRKIGGFTGDTLGATCELVELIPLFSVVMLVHLGVM